MKFTNNIVSRFGADKMLHFCVAGWVVSLSGYISFTAMIVAVFAVIILSTIKEEFLDGKPDWKDLSFAVAGIIVSIIFAIL